MVRRGRIADGESQGFVSPVLNSFCNISTSVCPVGAVALVHVNLAALHDLVPSAWSFSSRDPPPNLLVFDVLDLLEPRPSDFLRVPSSTIHIIPGLLQLGTHVLMITVLVHFLHLLVAVHGQQSLQAVRLQHLLLLHALVDDNTHWKCPSVLTSPCQCTARSPCYSWWVGVVVYASWSLIPALGHAGSSVLPHRHRPGPVRAQRTSPPPLASCTLSSPTFSHEPLSIFCSSEVVAPSPCSWSSSSTSSACSLAHLLQASSLVFPQSFMALLVFITAASILLHLHFLATSGASCWEGLPPPRVLAPWVHRLSVVPRSYGSHAPCSCKRSSGPASSPSSACSISSSTGFSMGCWVMPAALAQQPSQPSVYPYFWSMQSVIFMHRRVWLSHLWWVKPNPHWYHQLPSTRLESGLAGVPWSFLRSPIHLSSASSLLVANAWTSPSAVPTMISLVLLLCPRHTPSCHSDSILSLRSFCSRICLYQDFLPERGYWCSACSVPFPLTTRSPSLPTVYLETIVAAILTSTGW